MKKWHRWKFWLLTGLVIYLWPIVLTAQSLGLRLEQSLPTYHWNFIFESTTPITYRAFFLKNPNRFVFDISGDYGFYNQVSAELLRNTPIEKIHFAIHPNHQLRVVFVLKPNLKAQLKLFSAISTGNKYRLIAELISKSIRPAISSTSQIMLPKIAATRQIMIVIDPGHGGKDPGAIGRLGTKEKDVVLSIAKKLQYLINQQPGFKAELTRSGDYYLSLRQRLAIARQHKADMFIAIHADAYRDHKAGGASVFALSRRGATSEAARWLALRENQSELMGGLELADKEDMLRSVLINLSQTATIQASLYVGQNLLGNLHRITSLHHSQVEQAAFVVLKSPDIPSLLMEMGFLSNSQEEHKLRNEIYQQHLAQATMWGIRQYFIQRPKK